MSAYLARNQGAHYVGRSLLSTLKGAVPAAAVIGGVDVGIDRKPQAVASPHLYFVYVAKSHYFHLNLVVFFVTLEVFFKACLLVEQAVLCLL